MKNKSTMRISKIILSTIALAMTMWIFASCKKDDEKPVYTFKVGTESKVIKEAYFIYDENPNDDVYNHELDLLTDGFTREGNHINGTGSAVSFLIYSSTADLQTGTFTFSGNENSEPLNIWNASVYTDFTVQYYEELGYPVSTGGDSYEFTSGTLIVTKSGDSYTIEFSGEVEEEGTSITSQVSGKYVGSIESFPQD